MYIERIRDQQITSRILARFEFNPEYQQGISMADMLTAIGETSRDAAMQIAAALRSYGATNTHTRYGNRWNGMRWRA